MVLLCITVKPHLTNLSLYEYERIYGFCSYNKFNLSNSQFLYWAKSGIQRDFWVLVVYKNVNFKFTILKLGKIWNMNGFLGFMIFLYKQNLVKSLGSTCQKFVR